MGQEEFKRTATVDAANYKTWMQSEFCTEKSSIRGKSPQKCISSVPAQETAKHRAKFGWPCGERRRCSNEAKTRKRLKFAGVPETRQQISAVSGPSYHIVSTSGGNIDV